jgi:hypothetical protein
MNEITQKILEDRFEVLPQIIKDTIEKSNWKEKLGRICQKNNVLLDQTSEIETIVLMIMVGVLNPNELREELLDIGIKDDVAENIIRELESEIFGQIKTELVSNFEHFEHEDLKTESEEGIEVIDSEENVLTESEGDQASREDILKEIEDRDEEENLLQKQEIDKQKNSDSILNFIDTKTKTEIVTEDITPKETTVEKSEPVNSMANKLVTGSTIQEENISTPSTKLPDPYREPVQ